MDFDFDLQEFLSDMRRESREDIKELSTKIETKFLSIDDEIHDHDMRLFQMEIPAKRRRYVTIALLTAAVPFLLDVIFNHAPKVLSAMSATAVIK